MHLGLTTSYAIPAWKKEKKKALRSNDLINIFQVSSFEVPCEIWQAREDISAWLDLSCKEKSGCLNGL